MAIPLVKLIAQHLVDEQIGGEDFHNLIDSGDQDRFVKLKELGNKSKELEKIDSGDQDRFVKLKELGNKRKELENKNKEVELKIGN